MKRIVILAALIAAPALAQQQNADVASQRAQMEEVAARLQATAEQRNQQADLVAALSARLRAVEAELAAAKKAGEACKPEAAKK